MPMAVQLSPTVCRHIEPQRDQLMDDPAAIDHEVGTDAGQLVQLDVGDIARESVVGRGVAVVPGEVLHDHVRPFQQEAVAPVVAHRVAAHLGLARSGNGIGL